MAALACSAGPSHAEDGARLEIGVGARTIAPGEPLRVEVSSDIALESLESSFLGTSVYMTPLDDSGLRWTGWSMIGLDETPRTVTLEALGRTVDGRDASGTRSIVINSKDFPEENLSVAPKYVEPPKEVQERLARERAKLKKIYARRERFAPPTEPFVRPVSGINTSVFGMRRLFNGKPRSPHPGLDLRAKTGTPVRASGPGRVVLAEELYYSGNIVILDHGGGLFTLYGHLSEIDVSEGTHAEAGDVLGKSGATGRVTGPHLHWGAKIGNRPFDPTALLDARLFP